MHLFQPQRPPLVFDVLGSSRFRGHRRTAQNVADAGNLVDNLFDLLTLNVELLEHSDELFQRHEPDCFFQGLSLLHCCHVFSGDQDVVVCRQDFVQTFQRRVIETTNLQCLDNLVNPHSNAVEFLRLLFVHRVQGHRYQRTDLREQYQRARHREETGELQRVFHFLHEASRIAGGEEANHPRLFIPDFEDMPEVNAFGVKHLFSIVVAVSSPFGGCFATDVQGDTVADFFTEVLDQFLPRHEVFTCNPWNVLPLFRIAVQESIPGHTLPADSLVFDLFQGLGVNLALLRLNLSFASLVFLTFGRVVRLRLLNNRGVVFEPSHTFARDECLQHGLSHQIIEGRVVAKFVVDQEFETAACNIRSHFAKRIVILEASLDNGPRHVVVKCGCKGLSVAVEDVEGGFLRLPTFIELHNTSAVLAVVLDPLARSIQFLQP